MERIDLWQLSAFGRMLSLKLLLLLCQLLLYLKERDLEEAVEALFLQSRHLPVDDDVNFLLIVSRLHFELAHHEVLFLLEVILLILV